VEIVSATSTALPVVWVAFHAVLAPGHRSIHSQWILLGDANKADSRINVFEFNQSNSFGYT
jgi:hypothetical protein